MRTTHTRIRSSGVRYRDPSESTQTIASQFRITSAGKDAFNRTLPLHVPKLETRELIAAAGTTEEELVDDFKKLRRERRMQNR